jgi:tetratricopeptide (TPR) repeat protein
MPTDKDEAMIKDVRGMPVTAASAAALAGYETALLQFQSYVGNPVETLDATLAESPDFVLGQVFKALALFTASERGWLPDARAALEAATRHAAGANDRERGLIAATRALLDGEWETGSRLLDRVLVEHPRDAVALQAGHLVDFLRGDSANLRNRISRVLPHWSESVPGFSYVLGMHAFGLEEMNQYSDAEAVGRTALDLQPRDAWAIHAVAHVMEMQGRIGEGIAWLESRRDHWVPDNGFAFHNWWHLALFRMDGGDFDGALALYDGTLHAQPLGFALPLVDASALLWRLQLEGVEVAARFAVLADEWRARDERDFYAFNDFHAALAFAGAGREAELAAQIEHLRQAAERTDSNAAMCRAVGLPLAQGIAALARGQYETAIHWIEPVRDIATRFGGSHAQRDLITLTLIEAALRSGRHSLARHYLAEREVHKPESRWAKRLAQRARPPREKLAA